MVLLFTKIEYTFPKPKLVTMNFTLLQYYGGRDDGMSIFQILLIVFVIIAIYSLVKGASMLDTILSHWHHRFDIIPFSPQEFYQGIVDSLKAKEINHVSISRISYAQGGLLSPNREYLRIQYKTYIYDICAAPFAKGFFVSWWLGETGNLFRDFFINLPVIGKLFTRRKKTFFELDTEMMFKEMVTSCVKDTIEQLTKIKGMRNLNEADWKEYTQAY